MLDLTPTFYCASLLAIGTAAQWLAWRLRLPSIVLLLGFGFVVRWLAGSPDKYVSEHILFPLVSLAVGVILFEGGLSLRLRDVRDTRGVVARLVTVGLLITWILTSLAAYWILDFSPDMAALLGGLLTVSGPTVIVPLLRQVRLAKRIGSVIKWEGIVNDPIGAVLAALVFRAAVSESGAGIGRPWLTGLAMTMLVGVALGGAAAVLIIQLLRRYLIPDYLQSPVILAIVVVVFAVSNHFQPESGLVAVTLLGVVLANQRTVTLKHVIEFKENLRVLLIGTLFIVLASNVEISLSSLSAMGWKMPLFIAALVLVIRPAAVLASTLGSELPWNERLLLSWVHPRGIIAAAVASLLALDLSESGSPLAAEGETFVLVTFLVIVSTVAIYGLTVGPLARRLKLASPNPQGILFAGASPLVRAIATAVQEEGVATLLVDTNHQNIAAARMASLPVCFASIGSEFVLEETDFGGIGRLLAMTPNDEVNTLAAMEFSERFGRSEVYQLATTEPTSQRRDRVPTYRRGRTLFRKDATFELLTERFAQGATIKKTTLSSDFTYDNFRIRYGPDAIVLFSIDESGRLHVSTADGPKVFKAKQKLIALISAEDRSDKQSE